MQFTESDPEASQEEELGTSRMGSSAEVAGGDQTMSKRSAYEREMEKELPFNAVRYLAEKLQEIMNQKKGISKKPSPQSKNGSSSKSFKGKRK